MNELKLVFFHEIKQKVQLKQYKKHPKQLQILTKNAVFGGVIRNGIAHMTFGDFQILAGDKAVVFCLPEAIHKVEKLFN